MNEIFDSQTTFKDLGLSDEICRAVEDCGFEHPTHIQSKLIPEAVKGNDILGQSKTGTGKTAAFGLPILQRVEKNEPFAGLALVPTRELAIQVAREMEKFGAKTGLSILPVYGGQKITVQARKLERKPNIIIGTPGRVMDMNNRGLLPYNKVKIAVLDEVDRMLDIGFREDIRRILGSIKHKHQTVFVSATISPEIEKLARQYMNNPMDLTANDAKQLTVSQVEQSYVAVEPWDKRRLLRFLLKKEKPELTLIFCRTKMTVDRVAEDLKRNGKDVESLHADMHQGKRNSVMKRLREGNVDVIVASDLAARGIDVDNINLVVNYDLPEDPDIYVHRIGRTARRGRDGKAIAFVTPEQGPLLSKVEQLTNVEVTQVAYDDFEPGKPPEKIRQARAKEQAAADQHREKKSRSKIQLPDAEAQQDTSKFPGGIVPVSGPKKRLGGRLRTRRS
ncbi:MAG: DEAD/DEAH box helicase [Phycisphaerales bacterium]|nr:DEAD/DEAH box helicase [Phycisphaerales bacterium]